jgi:rsbT co-antagonist protein RsbR
VAAVPTRLRLTPDDKEAIAEFFRFYEPIAPEIVKELRESLMQLPEWQAVIRAIPPGVEAERNARSLDLQRTAYLKGDWAPYLEDLREQGVTYAKMGVSFIAWFDVIAIYRDVIRRRLLPLGQTDYARASKISNGLNRAVDIAMAHLGEAYLSAKEQIIAEQQAAIRELSLPILHVRDELLVIPIVGMIDTGRARQLIESLLIAIRDRRARGVVLDVTGVPVVDTAVANHLVQATESAKLMGALVVITGISPEMAQTLVTLGARLPAVETHIDLQEGIDQMERALGYRNAEG